MGKNKIRHQGSDNKDKKQQKIWWAARATVKEMKGNPRAVAWANANRRLISGK